MTKTNKEFRGIVVDRMVENKIMARTVFYATWAEAQLAAEKLCTRKFGKDNARYTININIFRPHNY
jgi:hypothetical protein